MFTTTNVAATAGSTGGGPVAAAVPPTFQLISTAVNGSSSSSSTSSTTTPTRRLTSTPTSSLIKQPAVVSIIHGNVNVTSSTSVPINSTGATMSSNTNIFYITTTNSQQHIPTTTGNLIIQSPQTVRVVSSPLHASASAPTLAVLNNSNSTLINNSRQFITTSNFSSTSSSASTFTSTSNNNFKPGICIDTPTLGRLAPITFQRQITNISQIQQYQTLNTTPVTRNNSQNDEQNNATDSRIVSSDNNSLMNTSQDQEIEIFVSNVVCSFALGCKLNLRKIAMEGCNVIYKRDQAMVLMKMRNPNCSANIWQSGKVTVTGTTSEDDARRAARRIARSLQRLGFKVKFRHYRVVNCLATCTMPWPIDIVKLSKLYSDTVSYEPEIHPGATVRLPEKAVLKVFTTGSITLTAPSVERINTAVNEFYPQLFECRKVNRDGGR